MKQHRSICTGKSLVTVLAAALALSGCEGFEMPGATPATGEAAAPARAGGAAGTERKVQRPDIFAKEAKGIWTGLPTLGTPYWVAAEGVDQAEQALVTNLDNGRTTEAALYDLDEEHGPAPIVLSDGTAQALGMGPNQQATLRVVALRTEVTEPEPVPDAAAPEQAETEASGAEAAQAGAAAAAEGSGNAGQDADSAAISAAVAAAIEAPAAAPNAPAPRAAAPALAPAPAPASASPDQLARLRQNELSVAAAASGATGDPTPTQRPYLRVQLVADDAAAADTLARLQAAGLPTRTRAEGGKVAVLAGPFATVGQRDTATARLKAIGFAGARPVK